jgi:hypothetical protein
MHAHANTHIHTHMYIYSPTFLYSSLTLFQSDSHNSPFLFEPSQARVISGEEEGVYGFVRCATPCHVVFNFVFVVFMFAVVDFCSSRLRRASLAAKRRESTGLYVVQRHVTSCLISFSFLSCLEAIQIQRNEVSTIRS